MKIALDAGHGFNTAGKRTPDGIREWTLNDRVLRAFENEIKKYKGVTTVRLDDPSGKTDIGLTARTNKAKNNNCDVLISFHHNAYKSVWGNHGGTETYIYRGRNSESLGNALQKAMINALGLRNRGVKYDNMHMNREVPFPSALVEVGFMDSNTDKAIRDPKNSEKVGIEMAKEFAKLYKLEKANGQAVKPTPKPKPTSDKVTVKKTATHFATGQKMDSWVKGSTFDVKERSGSKTLVSNKGSVIGWINNVDLVGGTEIKPKPQPSKPQTNSTSVKKGDKVRYNGYIYADSSGKGRGIKVNGTYTATIVNSNKYGIHLDKLGWAEKSKVIKVGGTSSTVTSKEIKKGSKVTTTATRDIFGTRLDKNTINSSRTFTVEQVGRNGNKNHILLKEVMTWVERNTVKVK